MNVNFQLIWEQLKQLEELEEQAHLREPNLTTHYDKHINRGGNIGDELFPKGMTKEQYDELCHALSSTTDVEPIGVGKDLVQGFITQTGRKIKFKRIKSGFNEFVVYVGDDIAGTAITYYNTTFSRILRMSNPYVSRYSDINYVYKSDFDGKFIGLDKFTPESDLTEDQFHEIRNKIRKGESLI